MDVSILDQTGDGRGLGGDRKHAHFLGEALEKRVNVVEWRGVLDFVHRGWLVLPDVYCRDDRTVEFVEKWPGRVCQLMLVTEAVYGKKHVNRARCARLLDRADVIVETGPFSKRACVRLPYVPWRPEPELQALGVDWSRPNAWLVTGTLRASKGQRELALDVLRGDSPARHLALMGNAQMWFSEDLRQKLIKETNATSGEFVSERWVRRDGQPKKSLREKPWFVKSAFGAVRYFGKYDGIPDLVELLRREAADGWRYRHVNPTLESWSPGHVEYTTLEALAAGMEVEVPDHVPVKQLYPRGLTLAEATKLHDPDVYAAHLVEALK